MAPIVGARHPRPRLWPIEDSPIGWINWPRGRELLETDLQNRRKVSRQRFAQSHAACAQESLRGRLLGFRGGTSPEASRPALGDASVGGPS